MADLLAFHQEHERAATLCDGLVAALPNTPEQRPARSFARQIALGHRADSAMVRSDREAAAQALSDWEQLVRDGGPEEE